jgi:hypothetical protein
VLQAIHARGEQRVLALSVDVPADVAKAETHMERADATFARFYAAEARDDAPSGLEQIADLERLGLPTTLVITPEGRVDSILRGPLR